MATTRKLLFITYANKEKYTGGGLCSGRNLEAVQTIFGKDNVSVYTIMPAQGRRSFKDKLRRVSEILKLYGSGMKASDVKAIVRMMEQDKFTDVFIDYSTLGLLAGKIKRRFPDVNIYVFYQNVEYDFMVSVTWRSGDYRHLFWIPVAWYNERKAARYADHIFTLNQKDRRRVERLYGRQSVVIPITLHDNYHDLDETGTLRATGSPKALFVGSYFPGNTVGLKMFCEQVLPQANIHLTVVGSGMEKFRGEVKPDPKLTVHGAVDDLTPFYEQADLMVLPIITGGGMKVKTAEALKYGKYIVGTQEAFEGYDLTEAEATLCRTPGDFVKALNSYNRKFRYCPAARRAFKERFSTERSLQLFREAIKL